MKNPNQKGYKLIELLIATGLMVVIAFSFVYLFSEIKRQQSVVEAKGEAIKLNGAVEKEILRLFGKRKNFTDAVANLPDGDGGVTLNHNNPGAGTGPLIMTLWTNRSLAAGGVESVDTVITTECDSTAGTRLADYPLETPPADLCPNLDITAAVCPGANRWVIHFNYPAVGEGPRQDRYFPGGRTAAGRTLTFINTVPLAALFCVDSSDKPPGPEVDIDYFPGDPDRGQNETADLRVDIAMAYLSSERDPANPGQFQIRWVKKTLILAVRPHTPEAQDRDSKRGQAAEGSGF